MKTSQNIQRLNFETFFRSNQDTCLSQRPLVKQGQWIGKGQLLADCINSVKGDLALGKNVLVAYMPWEGYNFEDSIVISDRLIAEDIYTSIHILRFRTEVVDNLSTKSSFSTNANYKFSKSSESQKVLSKIPTIVTPLLLHKSIHGTSAKIRSLSLFGDSLITSGFKTFTPITGTPCVPHRYSVPVKRGKEEAHRVKGVTGDPALLDCLPVQSTGGGKVSESDHPFFLPCKTFALAPAFFLPRKTFALALALALAFAKGDSDRGRDSDGDGDGDGEG